MVEGKPSHLRRVTNGWGTDVGPRRLRRLVARAPQLPDRARVSVAVAAIFVLVVALSVRTLRALAATISEFLVPTPDSASFGITAGTAGALVHGGDRLQDRADHARPSKPV